VIALVCYLMAMPSIEKPGDAASNSAKSKGAIGMELSYYEVSGCLGVEMSGAWREAAMKQAIEAIRDEAIKRISTRLLIDARKVSHPDNEMTRFFTGMYIAKTWGHPFKAAVVASPEVYNGFAEQVAVNRFATFEVFFEEEKALEWLLESAP